MIHTLVCTVIMHLYNVKQYGGECTRGQLWIPTSNWFTSYDKAYAHFKSISTFTDGEVYVNKAYDPKSASNEYIVIEERECRETKMLWVVVIARYGDGV